MESRWPWLIVSSLACVQHVDRIDWLPTNLDYLLLHTIFNWLLTFFTQYWTMMFFFLQMPDALLSTIRESGHESLTVNHQHAYRRVHQRWAWIGPIVNDLLVQNVNVLADLCDMEHIDTSEWPHFTLSLVSGQAFDRKLMICHSYEWTSSMVRPKEIDETCTLYAHCIWYTPKPNSMLNDGFQ